MRRILCIAALLLLLFSCAQEPESKYRLEYNEVTKEYRVVHWTKTYGWAELLLGMPEDFYKNTGKTRMLSNGMSISDWDIIKIDTKSRESVEAYLTHLREEEAEDKKRTDAIDKTRKAWKEVKE